jgi:hypothetical protein
MILAGQLTAEIEKVALAVSIYSEFQPASQVVPEFLCSFDFFRCLNHHANIDI